MHTIAITTLAIALALLALGLRGRVVARGRFCRKCRFDLAGLGDEQTACPECGRALTRPRSTRAAMRRPRRGLLALSAALALTAGAIGAAHVPALSARIVAHAPDGALAVLDRLDFPGAWDEVNDRLADPLIGRPGLAILVGESLDASLDPGADADSPHAARLAAAVVGAQLTDEQAERFFASFVRVEAAVQDHAAPDAAFVPSSVEVRFAPDAVGLQNAADGRQTAYTLTVSIDRGGPAGDGELFAEDATTTFSQDTPVRLHAFSFTYTNIRVPLGDTPGESAVVRMGVRADAVNPRTGARTPVARITQRQAVGVGAEPERFASLSALDPLDVAAFAGSLTISRIDESNASAGSGTTAIFSIRYTAAPPADAVYAVRVVPAGADPIDAGSFTLPADDPVTANYAAKICMVTIPDAPGASGISPAARWRDARTADVVLIPDPDEASEHPSYGPILPLPLIIRDVPIIRGVDAAGARAAQATDAAPRRSAALTEPAPDHEPTPEPEPTGTTP